MDFFKSVFVEDPDPPSPGSEPESSPSPKNNPPTQSSASADGSGISGGWSFGGLVKTLSSRSESVIETYRRDLEEFGSGLKKETVTLREVASRAVKDLPSSIEISASKAQGAFSSIADIIAQGKETLLAPDLDSDSSDHAGGVSNMSAQSVGSGRYSRFDAQLRAIQCDMNTYVDDPEDVGDYNDWKLGFDLGEKGEEIEDLMSENGAIGGIYNRVVPDSVDHEGFWCRYFYRVHRLQQAESVRANLVKRAISKEDEEELSWDVDDDEEEEEEEEEEKKGEDLSNNNTDLPLQGNNLVNKELGSKASDESVKETDSANVGSSAQEVQESSHTVESVVEEKEEIDVVESIKEELSNVELSSEGASESKDTESSKKSNEEVTDEVRAEASESSKDADMAAVPTQPSPEEEDLGWDEIEDLGSDDDKKVTSVGGSSDRSELRKRLSAPDDDEDLSWDIEDDDEPIKS